MKNKTLIIFASLMMTFSLAFANNNDFQNSKNIAQNVNPRGEERPQDGRGHGNRSEKRENSNKGECRNPDKGTGYGQGQGHGNGNYRK